MQRILLIDDDAELGPPLAAYFGRFGLELAQALRPSSGLAMLQQGGWDAAILDVMRQSTEADFAKPDFRLELAAKIKIVMNDVLLKYEDFGGIEDVFFTSFVTQ